MKLEQVHSPTQRRLMGLVCAILVLSLALAALPQSTAQAVTCKFKHKVEPGETLIYLGNLYQIGWTQIAEANKITAPYTITAGMVLCIPGGVKPSTVTTTTTKKGKEPVLSVVANAGHILVSVENFAPKTSYYVRVFARSFTVSYRLGHFTTNKDGDFTDWFKMPTYVPRTDDMALCVKNVITDSTSCVRYADPWATVYLNTPTCAINGR